MSSYEVSGRENAELCIMSKCQLVLKPENIFNAMNEECGGMFALCWRIPQWVSLVILKELPFSMS